MKRKDIRLTTREEKEKVYEEVDRLYHQGFEVNVKEHKSGFPAVTLDCRELHYLTDCLSLERWWQEHKDKHPHEPKGWKGG